MWLLQLCGCVGMCWHLYFKCAACFVHVYGEFSVLRELVCFIQWKSSDIRRATGDFQAEGGWTRSATVGLLQASVAKFQLNGHAVDADVMEDIPDLLMEHFDSTERAVELGGDSHVHRGYVTTLCQLPQVRVVHTQDPGKTAHFLHCAGREETSAWFKTKCFIFHIKRNKEYGFNLWIIVCSPLLGW